MPILLNGDYIPTKADRELQDPPSIQSIFIWEYLINSRNRNIPLHVQVNLFIGEPQTEWDLCLITNYEIAHAFLLIEMQKKMHEGGYNA